MKKLLIIAITIIVSIGTTNKVNAETLTTWTTQQGRIQTTHDGTDTWTSWTNINGDNSLVYDSTNLTYPVKAIAYHLKTNNGLSRNNEYSFRINYKPTPDSLHLQNYTFENSTTGQTENVTCTQTQASSGFYWLSCSFSPQTDYSSNDYLYVKLNFYQSYLTELRIGVRGYETLLGTNAVITEQTENIINNQNNNTEEIINQLETTTQQIGNQLLACTSYTTTIGTDNYYLNASGNEISNNTYGITNYIDIEEKRILIDQYLNSNGAYYCLYDSNKTKTRCLQASATTNGKYITPNNNEYYIRLSFRKTDELPKIKICSNALNQEHTYNGNTSALDTAITTAELGETMLKNLLDLDEIDIEPITINANPSNFIWEIVTNLKEINAKVTLLFMTILGLGIMKMILNR